MYVYVNVYVFMYVYDMELTEDLQGRFIVFQKIKSVRWVPSMHVVSEIVFKIVLEKPASMAGILLCDSGGLVYGHSGGTSG